MALFSFVGTSQKPPWGRRSCSSGENEERMQFIGYNPAVSRMILFTLTAFFAGLAGSFYALFFKFVGVDAIGIDMTTTALLMTFIGGTKAFFGPVLGAGFYIYFQNYLSNITDRWPLFMGLLFVLMVLFCPSRIVRTDQIPG